MHEKQGMGRAAFLRMLTGGVAVQALLSAANFLVGLMLVRRAPDAQYGYYVLIATVVLMATTLQGSFIQPPTIFRFTRANREQRADLIGGLLRDQARLSPYVIAITLLICMVAALLGRLTSSGAALVACATLAVVAAMRREFFRMVLFAYRRPEDVLKSDAVYCVLLASGAFVATLTPWPAAAAAISLSLAATVGAALSSRALWRHESWNRRAPLGTLRDMAPQGAWSAFGGGTHWLFSQGYNYLVAGALDVTAVAALAATRLLVMPIGLLSTGIGTLMLPTVSRWTNDLPAGRILRRLALFATGLATLAACYVLVMWLARDWIFGSILKKNFAQRDLLLLTWAAIALVTVFRDQLLYFLTARARFRVASSVTFVSALLSFAVSFTAMRHYGVIGALFGLLSGELANVLGIIVFSLREARRAPLPIVAV